MQFRALVFWVILIGFAFAKAQEVKSQVVPKKAYFQAHTIAFYNVENLFDPQDDPFTYDDDRTPNGKDKWTEEIYVDKVKKMARVISEIGVDFTNTAPTLIGLAEVENLKTIQDLANDSSLLSYNYGIIHFDSPDRRGIDVALLYKKDNFKIYMISKHELFIYDLIETDERKFTRDQLLVSGYLDGDLIHIIINHWPSRSGGEARSQKKRIAAARLNMSIIDSLYTNDPYAKIITMGDFNDDPTSPSIKKILKTQGKREKAKGQILYNPFELLFKRGIGTLAYRDGINLFDQIIVSASLLEKNYSSYRFYRAGIYDKNYLKTPKGRYKGYPFRSFANGVYTGGYSDHFPVYAFLIKEAKSGQLSN